MQENVVTEVLTSAERRLPLPSAMVRGDAVLLQSSTTTEAPSAHAPPERQHRMALQTRRQQTKAMISHRWQQSPAPRDDRSFPHTSHHTPGQIHLYKHAKLVTTAHGGGGGITKVVAIHALRELAALRDPHPPDHAITTTTTCT